MGVVYVVGKFGEVVFVVYVYCGGVGVGCYCVGVVFCGVVDFGCRCGWDWYGGGYFGGYVFCFCVVDVVIFLVDLGFCWCV